MHQGCGQGFRHDAFPRNLDDDRCFHLRFGTDMRCAIQFQIVDIVWVHEKDSLRSLALNGAMIDKIVCGRLAQW